MHLFFHPKHLVTVRKQLLWPYAHHFWQQANTRETCSCLHASTMSSRVRALNITHVHPAETGDPSLPCHGEHKLSFLDLIQIPQRLFFYDGPDLPSFRVKFLHFGPFNG
jgi:hypothetical protein